MFAIAERLIAKGADANVQGALFVACWWGNLSIVQQLLAAGADMNAETGELSLGMSPSNVPRTPLQAACRNGYLEVVPVVWILLEAGADVNAPPAAVRGGRTTLQATCERGQAT